MSDFKKNGRTKAANGMTLPKVVELVAKLSDAVAACSAKLEEVVAKNQEGLAKFAAMEVGKQGAMYNIATKQLGEAIEHIDLNVLATAEILKEIFGQLTQVDFVLGKLPDGIIQKATPEDIEKVRTDATEWLKRITLAAFDKVQRERAEEEERKAAAASKAKAEAQKAAQDKTEAEKVEAELRESEARNLAPISGGAGAEVPQGADVFGG